MSQLWLWWRLMSITLGSARQLQLCCSTFLQEPDKTLHTQPETMDFNTFPAEFPAEYMPKAFPHINLDEIEYFTAANSATIRLAYPSL